MRHSKLQILLLLFCAFLVGWLVIYAQAPATLKNAPSVIPKATAAQDLDLAGEWEGSAEWKGIKFTITFSVPPDSREVRDLEVFYECIQGEGGMSATLTEPAPISEKNTFEFTAGQGSQGTGSFLSSESAKGTYKAPFSLKCGEEFLQVSGEWTAQKKEE